MNTYTIFNSDATSCTGMIIVPSVWIIGESNPTFSETCPNEPDELEELEEPILAAPKPVFERAPVRPRLVQRRIDARARLTMLRHARGPM